MDRIKQCQARSKRSGQRCKRYASKGMDVCHMHGGKLGGREAQKARYQAALRHGLCTKKALQTKKELYQLIRECRKALL